MQQWLIRPKDFRFVFGGSSWNIILCTRRKYVQPNHNAQFVSETIMEISCTKISLHKGLNVPQQGAAAILQSTIVRTTIRLAWEILLDLGHN